jgi:group I intron endonuclease
MVFFNFGGRMIFYLYKYTNVENGKAYIGVTNNLTRRHYSHTEGYGGAKLFSRALKKHGVAKFRLEILAVFDDADAANYHEGAAIKSLGTLVPSGYNLTAGSPFTQYNKGHAISEKTKELLSLKMAGRPSWNSGKHLSKAHKQNLSKAMRKITAPPWNKGLRTPKKTRAKLRAAAIARYKLEE